MDALILSGGTGGGHNGAAYAIEEEMNRRGHRAVILDPYTLVSDGLAKTIGSLYIRMVQKNPRLFSALYYLGKAYSRLPLRSPVYAANCIMRRPMAEYLQEHHFDALLMTHLFPAEIITALKRRGEALPPTFYIATDYTCIPFTEELCCDYLIIPHPALTEEFVKHGVAEEKIRSFGIPVRAEFRRDDGCCREERLQDLSLPADKRYILLTGGSPRVRLLSVTNRLGDYMKISDVLITKPGGLTSTEAASCGIPLIHVSSIAGCETKNLKFFSRRGMSINLSHHLRRIGSVLEKLKIPENAQAIIRQQKDYLPPAAAEQICSFVQSCVP